MTDNVIKQPNIDTENTTQNLLNAYENNEIMSEYMPIIDSLSNNASINSAELLNVLLSSLNLLKTPIQTIKDMSDVKIIGGLASTVAQVFTSILNIYALIITLHLMHFKGIPFGYDDPTNMISELKKSDILNRLSKLKQTIHKTSDANNITLTTANLSSVSSSESIINELIADVEGMKPFTLDKFLNDNESLLTSLGIDKAYLNNGYDPYYLQLKSVKDVQEKLNDSIVDVVRQREEVSKEDYMK